jgi:regulator of replication initiation timing
VDPLLKDILQSIFTRVKELEDVVEQQQAEIELLKAKLKSEFEYAENLLKEKNK